jgi:hypothetical protein
MGRAGVAMMVAQMAVEAIKDVATAPIKLNQAFAGAVGQANPWLNFRIEQARIGRMGGFDPEAMQRLMMRGGVKGQIPMFQLTPQMRALGMGPLDVQRNIANLGIAPQSPEEAMRFATTVRQAYFGGTGLTEDQSAQFLGRGIALGGGGVAGQPMRFWMQLEKVMSTATAMGLDRSDTLRTMSGLLERGGGAGLQTSQLADMIARLAQTGIPSMRTGEGILGLQQDVNRTLGGLGTGQSQAANMAFGLMFGREGAPQTEAGLQKFLGISNEDWKTIVDQPGGQRLVQNYLQSAQQKNPILALQNLGLILQSPQSPITVNTMLERQPWFKNLPSNQQDLFRSQILGTSLLGSTALGAGRSLVGANTASMGMPLTYDTSKDEGDYRQRLTAMGVRPDLIDTVIQEAKAKNVNPLLMGAIMMNESTGGKNTAQGAFGMSAADNPMQIAGSSGLARPTGAADSIAKGASLLQQAITRFGPGDLYNVGKAYAGEKDFTTDYQAKLLRGLTSGGVALPEMQLQAAGQMAGLTAARDVATYLGVLQSSADLAATAITNMTGAVNRFVERLGSSGAVSPWLGEGFIPNAAQPIELPASRR